MTTSDCLFCKILSRQIPAQVVYEDEKFMAIKDINPAAPVHILLLPQKHISSLNDASPQDLELLGHLQLNAVKLAQELGIAEQGYRLVNNCGDFGGQTIAHLHYHLLGGRELAWPPG